MEYDVTETQIEGPMLDGMSETMERLAAAAAQLEQAVDRLQQRQAAMAEDAEASIGRIVATVESRRELELEQKLAAAEARISELQARAAVPAVIEQKSEGRKTLPPAMTTLLAKQGVTVESMEAGALDGALGSLSLEQRMAVKAQLLRAGLLA